MKHNKVNGVVYTLAVMTYVLSSSFLFGGKTSAANAITFPVIGPASFSNDFDAPRGNVKHNAIDILAKKGQQLVAAVDGTITFVAYPEPSWGYSVSIRDKYGYEYSYLHMNDDNWGTNNGAGGPMRAYAADVKEGNHVQKGQLLGYVGDSGHANGVSHLHFEMYEPGGRVVNPYESLVKAPHISKPALYQALDQEILPYGRTFKGGASIEAGNFDGDIQSEYVIGSGPGMDTSVRVYNNDDTVMKNIDVYAPGFRGGVNVTAGDIDNNGVEEIITGAGTGGTPLVKIYALNGTELGRFYAYDTHMNKNGVMVASCDVDGDGTDEIITAPGPGTGPLVKVYDAEGHKLSSFYAYGQNTKFGVDLTCADVIGSTADDIVTGPLKGGNPLVKVFSPDGTVLSDFYAYSQQTTNGVRVSAGDVRPGGKAEILTVSAAYATQHIKIYGGDGSYIKGQKFLEEWWEGFHDVAAGYDGSKATTGVNRRTSIRAGIE